MIHISQTEIVWRLGWTLLHFLWEGTAIAAVTGFLLAVLRKRSPNARYIVGCVALLFMLGATGVTLWMVPGSPPVEPRASNAVLDVHQSVPLLDQQGSEPTPKPALLTRAAQRSDASQSSAEQRHPVNVSTPWRERLTEMVSPHLKWIVAAWLIGALALSLRLLGGWIKVQRLRRHWIQPVEERCEAILAELRHRLRVSRPVRLLVSTAARVPMVIGWLKPMILLPACTVTGLSPEQLRAILAHELAHIRRHDYAINLLQTLVETLLFYHPAVWWLSRRIRLEREHCCDDLAVACCGDAMLYARTLAALEELRRIPQLAAAATGSSLLNRVRRILGAPVRPSDHLSRWPAGALTTGTITVALLCLFAGTVLSTHRVAEADKPVATATQPAQSGVMLGTQPVFKAVLPNGVRVELLGVSRFPVTAQSWWEPDGSSKATGPYSEFLISPPKYPQSYPPDTVKMLDREFEKTIAQLKGSDRSRHFVLQLEGATTDAQVDVSVFPSMFSLWSGTGKPQTGGQPLPDAYTTKTALIPKNDPPNIGPDSTLVAVAVSSGTWRTIASGPATHSTSFSLIANPSLRGSFHEITAMNGGTQVTVVYQLLGDKDTISEIVSTDRLGKTDKQSMVGRKQFTSRVVAVDNEGNIHDGEVRSFEPLGETFALTSRFEDLAQKNIKEFRLQIRPYFYAQFKNVSIQPGHKTDVRVLAELSKPDGLSDREETIRQDPASDAVTDSQPASAPSGKSDLLTPRRFTKLGFHALEEPLPVPSTPLTWDLFKIPAKPKTQPATSPESATAGEIPVKFAKVEEAAKTLQKHFEDKHREAGMPADRAVKIVAHSATQPTATAPADAEGRVTKSYGVKGPAHIIAQELREKMKSVPETEQAIIKSSPSTNEIIVAARPSAFDLIEQILVKLENSRRFVRLVVGKEKMTFEGHEVNADDLSARMAEVPDPQHTVLELAVDSKDLAVARYDEVHALASKLAIQYGFEYLSYVGEHPLGSKGSSPASATQPTTATQPSSRLENVQPVEAQSGVTTQPARYNFGGGTFTLENVEAKQLIASLRKVVPNGEFGAYDKTNSIILVAPEKDIDWIADLIAKLDKPNSTYRAKIEERIEKVVHLKYANTISVAKTIVAAHPAPSNPAGDSEHLQAYLRKNVMAMAQDEKTILLIYHQSIEPRILALVQELDVPAAATQPSSRSDATETHAVPTLVTTQPVIDLAEGIDPDTPQISIESRYVIVSAERDQTLGKKYPMLDEPSFMPCFPDTRELEQFLGELTSLYGTSIEVPRLIAFDNRTVTVTLPNGSNKVMIDTPPEITWTGKSKTGRKHVKFVEYDLPLGYHLQVKVKTSEDRQNLNLVADISHVTLLEQYDPRTEEQAQININITMKDQQSAFFRIPVRRNLISFQTTKKVKDASARDWQIVRKPIENSVPDKYLYVLLRATIIKPGESSSATSQPASDDFKAKAARLKAEIDLAEAKLATTSPPTTKPTQ